MQRNVLLPFRSTRQSTIPRAYSTRITEPIVSIKNATFYRQHPSAIAHTAGTNPDIFPNLTFELASSSPKPEHWCIIGPSSVGKTTFFEILRGQHLCFPPTARSFPYLSGPEIEQKDHRLRTPSRAIQYVGFSGKYGGGIRSGNTTGAYLSARYESRREETDFSVLDYLKGNVELNPSNTGSEATRDHASLERVIKDLELGALVDMPVGNLSNGQTRRAKIAKALLGKPEVLLLDEPFMGLDPRTLKTLPPLLFNLAAAQSPRIVLSLRPQDPLPDWITHIVHLDPELRVAHQGPKNKVLEAMKREEPQSRKKTYQMLYSREGLNRRHPISPTFGFPIVEMENIRVKYGDKIALGNWSRTDESGHTSHGLDWTVRRNSRWGVFGPNGSGKTTLLSLICSDHPQSYSLPIRFFSLPRLPYPGHPGISIFELQSYIGHSSPEIHSFFPKHLSLRRCLESAWSDTFLSPPQLTYERDVRVDMSLRWFEPDLNPSWAQPSNPPKVKYPDPLAPPRKRLILHANKNLDLDASTDWAENMRFSDLPFSGQRVALFLRAVIKTPDLVVLDEAFSGMDASLRDKCMLFLTWGTARVFAEPRALNALRACRLEPKPWPKLDAPDLKPEEAIPGLSEEQALICVSHVKEEVPGLVRQWMCLPQAEGGGEVRFGELRGPLEVVVGGWERIWSPPRGLGRPKEKNDVEEKVPRKRGRPRKQRDVEGKEAGDLERTGRGTADGAEGSQPP
ncbi:MAG: hypothetical protein LQ352_006303 [Teloschistes flavicans]|nr:MAG: hypothetical protein LQ352_006303 [Teloschistes flavicans]